ncbi:MAG: TetR family transcriptional regulator [Rhodospirillaceae bacterium]|nr:TetR family transcriptional regulator [Rhodospirillaceae bacterium]
MARAAKKKRAARSRGAVPGLSKEGIVAAALALIDAEGLPAFSLRDVARRLGVYPTAIYWHVPGRNALLAEVVAQALRAILPPDDPAAWQDWLRGLFRRYRAAVRAHPNIAPLIGAQLVSNEGIDAGMIDGILAALTHAGYGGAGGASIVDAYNVVIAAMCGFVTMELAPLPADDPAGWAAALERRVQAIPSLAYPTLARHLPDMANRAFILRWQNGVEAPLEASFEAFIDCVIRGLEARARAVSPRRR